MPKGLSLTAPPQPLVPAPDAIRLGMLGSSVGNGHPYSWSALFNGYDRELMRKECPFPGIPDYLDKESADTLTIPGATVTHRDPVLRFGGTVRVRRSPAS